MTRWLQAAKQASGAGTELTKPTEPQPMPVLSVKSILSEGETHEAAPLRADKPETFPYGVAFGGRPKTWTGCVVSLEEWRGLSAWDKHGPNGRHWNGITRQWEKGGRT